MQNWIKITKENYPPDTNELMLVKDEYGNIDKAIPCYYPFKVGERTGGKYSAKIIPCEPYFDGWMIDCSLGLTTKIKGKITHYAK